MANILVVDDEEPILRLMNMIISPAHTPTCESTGDGAARTLLAHPQKFDLVITDIGMPGLSGLDLAEWVCHAFPELPVVVVSGLLTSQSDLTSRRLMDAGVRAVLAKPFRAEKLVEAIRRVLGE